MNKIKKIKIAINGFGRIGRAIAKINDQHNLFDLVLINDSNPFVDNLAYLFKYDSTYGKFPGKIANTESAIIINNTSTVCTSFHNMNEVPWEKYGVDIIIDSSGVEANTKDAKKLIKEGLNLTGPIPADTAFTPKVVDAASNATLLYHEATFMEAEKQIAIKTKHSTASDAGRVAKEANVDNLMLGHFSNRYRHLEDLLSEAQAVFKKTSLAIEGDTVSIENLD
ncbi:MAG: glyceraldehyde 3-phosphate dehydrogenase NAD-binding domain-containing protein [Candidatus Thioglobus sp.]